MNNGMFLMLKGFEAQVFTDVRQVVDNAEGKYAKLYELLNGAGTEDLEIAWQEYRYKELYAELEKFLSVDLLTNIHEVFTPADTESKAGKAKASKKKVNIKNILKESEKAALAYYEMEEKFIQQAKEEALALAEKEAAADPKKKAAAKKKPAKAKSAELTPAKKFAEFIKQVEYLYKIFEAAQKSSGKKSAVKATLENDIYRGFETNRYCAEILVSFAAVSNAGADNLAKWGFNRKLSDLIARTDFAEKDMEMRNVFSRIFLCSKVSKLSLSTSEFAKSAYEAAKLIAEGKDSFLLCGANEYDGTIWFNKEKMEATLWYALAVNSMLASRILREQVYDLYRTMNAAKEKAEYKCRLFVEALMPAEKKRKTAAKKASAAKKTSGKKESGEKKATVKKAAEPRKIAAEKIAKVKKPAEEKKATAAKKTSPAKKAEAGKKASVKKTTTVKKAEAEKKAATTKKTAEKKTAKVEKKTVVKKATAKKSEAVKKTEATKKIAETKKATASKKTAAKKTSAKAKTDSKKKK